MALEKEQDTYREKLPELEQDEGKFVVIHGDKIFGLYDTYTDALGDAYREFKLDAFLIRQIQGEDRALLATRALAS